MNMIHAMSHLSESELDRLKSVAVAIREADEDRGHNVGTAVGLDKAFSRTAGTARALRRTIVLDAVEGVQIAADVTARHHGHWLKFETFDDGAHRHYRVKSGSLDEAGNLRVMINSDSAIMDVADDCFFRDEPWVLIYTFDANEEIEAIYAAEVLGISSERVAHLELARPILLDSKPTPPQDRFPTDEDEDLPGMDGDAGEATGAA